MLYRRRCLIRALTRVTIGAICALLTGACVESTGQTGGSYHQTAGPAVPQSSVLREVAVARNVSKLPPDLKPSLAQVRGDTGFALLSDRGCLGDFNDTSVELSHCDFGDPTGKKTLIVVGDSHSAMWAPAFDELGTRAGWKVLVFNKVNCGAAALRPYLQQESRSYDECVDWHEWTVSQVNSLRPQMVVFTSEVRAFRLADGGHNTPATWQEGLSQTLSAITSPDTKKVVLGDIPYVWPGTYGAGPTCLATHSNDLQHCSAPRTQAVLEDFQQAEEAAASANSAQYIDTTKWFCTDRCWSVVNKMQVYSDWQHITATYARHLSGALQEELGLQ